ncbi:DUF2182 domain-containing protein [Polymorphum gilvum]|uniref:DUF2182 domain-containing protein n=1 Tax=Polymorphum gilvum TaxID=991904 RepID=UPI001F5603EA|nr:DUF2182 domain-containing protein [Polymorphum gilvum]
MNPDSGALPASSRKARVLVILLAGSLALVGWAYLAAMVADMVPVMDMTEAGPGMGLFNAFNLFAGLSAEARAALAVLCLPGEVATFGMPAETWGASDFGIVFLMWLMMTLAMMLPSAVPVIDAFVSRTGASARSGAVLSTAAFLIAGYLSVWAAYALVATLAQWGLTLAGMMSPMMAPASLVLSGTTLVAAGLYQFTPAKQACLVRCWVPRWQIAGSGRPTFVSLYGEGVAQGLACFGCCWALMTVMFAVGVMNIVWIALLGIIMIVEKNIPSSLLYRAIGVFLLVWGGFLIAVATGMLG